MQYTRSTHASGSSHFTTVCPLLLVSPLTVYGGQFNTNSVLLASFSVIFSSFAPSHAPLLYLCLHYFSSFLDRPDPTFGLSVFPSPVLLRPFLDLVHGISAKPFPPPLQTATTQPTLNPTRKLVTGTTVVSLGDDGHTTTNQTPKRPETGSGWQLQPTGDRDAQGLGV